MFCSSVSSRGKAKSIERAVCALTLTYNFKDGTEAIPLKAVEDAFGSDLTQVAPPNPRNPNIIPIGDGFGFFLFISSLVV